MDHSFEEIRSVALDILSGRERSASGVTNRPNQYDSFKVHIASVFIRRGEIPIPLPGQAWSGNSEPRLSEKDRERFLEIFWGLFREGIITLGINDSNPNFPFFRVSEYGERLLSQKDAYFFHDVSSFEKIIRNEIPEIDETTVMYLKECMQAFRSGCILAATVMLGVATEHVFCLLIETIERSSLNAEKFKAVSTQRTILQKINKFKNILDQQLADLPSEIKEDLDTNFVGILSIIRNFRNQSGHPTGKIIDREQAYVLMQLFIPYSKKMYQLKAFFS